MLALKPRTGFTFVELLVVIILLAIVGGAIHDGLRRQQQVFRSIASMTATRGDLRDAAEVLAADLAAASPLDTLPVASDSAVEFFSSIASSVSCDSAPAYTLRLPPEKLASGIVISSLLVTPDSGDVLLVYNDDTAGVADSPRWDRHTIASMATQSASLACPVSTGLTAAGDALATAYLVNLRSPASPAIRRGAPVRILRRMRYSFYRSGSLWYLGQRRCNALGPSVCGVIQPLSGPYARYSSTSASGIAFRYFDAALAPLDPSSTGTRTARIDIAVRSPPLAVQLGTAAPATHGDSARTTVALRNRD